MSLPLISFDDYKATIAMKSLFNGFFWTKDGNLFKVDTLRQATQRSRPSYPNERSIRYTNGTRFFDNETKKTTITLQEIGSDDVVYDEQGNFVCIRMGHDSGRKGEIFIRKSNKKNKDMNTSYSEHWGIKLKEFEDIPLKSSLVRDVLSPEAYSKIGKDLAGLRNGKISIQMLTTPDQSFYNMTKGEARQNDFNHVNAFASAERNIVVAIISPGVEKEILSTIWNVMNLLGVHEMKHVIYPWTGNDMSTHHLNYMFQKGHHSWDKTTRYFREEIKPKLKSKYYKPYDESIKANPSSITIKDYKEFGIYPRQGETFESIENRVINTLNNKDKLRELDDYFRRYDEYKHYKRRD